MSRDRPTTTAKSGSTINGDYVKIVVVKTNLDSAPDPANPGTGTIVATFCDWRGRPRAGPTVPPTWAALGQLPLRSALATCTLDHSCLPIGRIDPVEVGLCLSDRGKRPAD